jgi:hypothetical protein
VEHKYSWKIVGLQLNSILIDVVRKFSSLDRYSKIAL